MKKFIIVNTLLAMSGLLAGQTMAAEVQFTGTLVIPPICTVKGTDDSDVISVVFDSRMDVSKVDGVNFKQPIPYKIDCATEGASTGLDMKLILTGENAPFANGKSILAVAQQHDILGIRIFQEGAGGASDFPLSTKNKIEITNQPKLWAAPTKKADSTLEAGAFTATAQLTAIYE